MRCILGRSTKGYARLSVTYNARPSIKHCASCNQKHSHDIFSGFFYKRLQIEDRHYFFNKVFDGCFRRNQNTAGIDYDSIRLSKNALYSVDNNRFRHSLVTHLRCNCYDISETRGRMCIQCRLRDHSLEAEENGVLCITLMFLYA